MSKKNVIDSFSSPEELNSEQGLWSRLAWQSVVIWAVTTGILIGAVFLLDNTNLVTTNGLWKSIPMREWVEETSYSLDPANLLYYPLNSSLIRLFPEELFGPVWRRMAFLNTVYGGLAISLTYMLMRSLSVSFVPALAAALFQLCCGFFFALSITSEDIMGGYCFILSSEVLMIYTCRRATHWSIAAIAALFTLGWFFEWRLAFASAPPLVLSILFFSGTHRERLLRLLTFAGVTLTLPLIPAVIYGLLLHQRLWYLYFKFLWTGKGLGTGYGGFSVNKIWFMLIGITQYWIGGANIGSLNWLEDTMGTTLATLAVIAVLGVVFVRTVRAKWSQPEWRTISILLGGTFLFGEFFNFYSQPQDPQMQLNVMTWLPIAYGILTIQAIDRFPAWSRALSVTALVMTAIGLPSFLAHASGSRHADSIAQRQVVELQTKYDFESTIFVFNGFEGFITWIAAEVDHIYPPDLVASPQSKPRFKAIYLLDQGTRFPNRSAEESAEAVTVRIDEGFAKGFGVVINEVWNFTEGQLVDSFATVSGPEKPRAIYRVLHDHYEAYDSFEMPGLGMFYRLRPKG